MKNDIIGVQTLNMHDQKRLKGKRRIMLTVLSLILCYLSQPSVVAQTLTANAPSRVAVGEQFRLSYKVNTQDVSDFRISGIPDAFEVLMGPSTSQQSSYQFVNGHASQSSSVTYTYILYATKNGTFTIPAARINAEGKTITSQALKITVSGTSQNAQQSNGRQRQSADDESMRAAGSRISGSDLFIKVSANISCVFNR